MDGEKRPTGTVAGGVWPWQRALVVHASRRMGERLWRTERAHSRRLWYCRGSAGQQPNTTAILCHQLRPHIRLILQRNLGAAIAVAVVAAVYVRDNSVSPSHPLRFFLLT